MVQPRIMSGRYGGRALRVWRGGGDGMRPTLARVRKSLFDILSSQLGGRVNQLTFADIFAGCGAVGLEALSLGFGKAIFLESQAQALSCLRHNIEVLAVKESVEVLAKSAFSPLPKSEVGVLFFDPPYDCGDIWLKLLHAYQTSGWIGKETIIVIQHVGYASQKQALTKACESLDMHVYRGADYGKHRLSFIKAAC